MKILSVTHEKNLNGAFRPMLKCEAFDRVTVEAMLGELPVIGSNIGGALELFQDSYDGELVCESAYGGDKEIM